MPKIMMERMNKLEINKNADLQPEEAKLLQHILILNERSIAFTDDKQETFQSDYFSDYHMLVMEHKPWLRKRYHSHWDICWSVTLCHMTSVIPVISFIFFPDFSLPELYVYTRLYKHYFLLW